MSSVAPGSRQISPEAEVLRVLVSHYHNANHRQFERETCPAWPCDVLRNAATSTKPDSDAGLRENLAAMVEEKIKHLAQVGISELNWHELESLPSMIRGEQLAHEKGRLIGVRLFDLLDLVVAAREHSRNFAQHIIANITRPVSDEEIDLFAKSLLSSPEYTAEDVEVTREMITAWRECEDTIQSLLTEEQPAP